MRGNNCNWCACYYELTTSPHTITDCLVVLQSGKTYTVASRFVLCKCAFLTGPYVHLLLIKWSHKAYHYHYNHQLLLGCPYITFYFEGSYFTHHAAMFASQTSIFSSQKGLLERVIKMSSRFIVLFQVLNIQIITNRPAMYSVR